MRRAVPFLVLVTLVLAACGTDTVGLSYRLQEGRRLQYRLRLEADVDRALEGETREQRVEAAFRLGQEVLETMPEGGARARMSLTPVSLVVDGQGGDVGPSQEFIVTLGPRGEIVALEDATGMAPEPLELVGIERLLPRLQPVLPGDSVELGDRWTSETDLSDEDGTFSLEARSRLDRLGRTGGSDSALVRTTYTSPVDRQEPFANAVADLAGRDIGTQEAWFALDGFLIRSSGDSVGRYRVTFRPPQDAGGLTPVDGRLEVRLHTELELVESRV